MGGTRRKPRGGIRAAALLAAVGLTVALAQQPVHGAFTAVTGSSGNSVGTAAQFCTSPGNATVTATADSFVDQGSPTSVSGGTATYLVVTPQAGSARRMFLKFDPLPTIPSRCVVSSASLQVYADSATAGRTLGAYRVDPTAPAWTEAGLNWNNRPAGVGTATTVVTLNSNQYVYWTVTDQVRDMYSLGNNGFMVRDQDETGGGAWQQFNSRAVATNKPRLVVAWD